MKYIILASSIFYLLGLKFTANIDLNSKFQNDTVQAKEVCIPKEIKEQKPSQDTVPQVNDTIKAEGSGELLAPYIHDK